MNLDKFSLTLYDFLAYLFPGYIVLFTCSVVDASFFGGASLTVDTINKGFFIYSITAYFLGHLCHRVGSYIKDRYYKLFINNKDRLSPELMELIRKKLTKHYKIPVSKKLNNLEIYILADGYIVAQGGSPERDILMAREGFYKASTVAFFLLTMTIFATLTTSGVAFSVVPNGLVRLNAWGTILAGLISLFITLVLRNGFVFYNRTKINNVLVSFLALTNIEEKSK